jgi:hypothetical protein
VQCTETIAAVICVWQTPKNIDSLHRKPFSLRPPSTRKRAPIRATGGGIDEQTHGLLGAMLRSKPWQCAVAIERTKIVLFLGKHRLNEHKKRSGTDFIDN